MWHLVSFEGPALISSLQCMLAHAATSLILLHIFHLLELIAYYTVKVFQS